MNRAPSQPDLDTPSEPQNLTTEPRHGAPGRASATAATVRQSVADAPRASSPTDTPPLPGASDVGLFAGRVIGDKYRLLRHLGSGGMGTVFSAEHVTLRKHVALKFLRSDAATRDRAVRRFEREAQLLARLDHENIVSLLDIGRDPTALDYLVLEFIRGRTLRDELQEGRLSTERVVAIVAQVARGLTAAHEAGVIHRDLKPENVMLTQHADGRLLVKLLDFGVARLRENEDETLTLTGQALGTAGYMSPEQARGDAEIDSRSDVYALGVIAYEALTGVRPHDGNSYNETLFRVLNHPHKAVRELCPELPEAIEGVMERALAKQVRDRYSSPWRFAIALQEVLRGASAGDLANVTLHSPTADGEAGLGASHEAVSPGAVEGRSADGDTQGTVSERRPAVPWRVAAAGAALGLAVGVVAASAGRTSPDGDDAPAPPTEPASPVDAESTPRPAAEAFDDENATQPPAASPDPAGQLPEPVPRASTPPGDVAALSTSAPSTSAPSTSAPKKLPKPKARPARPAETPPSLPRLGGDYADSPYVAPGPGPSKGP